MKGGQIMSTYVLIHGAWHGGWCWDKVVPLLEKEGHNVNERPQQRIHMNYYRRFFWVDWIACKNIRVP